LNPLRLTRRSIEIKLLYDNFVVMPFIWDNPVYAVVGGIIRVYDSLIGLGVYG
jgi:hypothetical protein